MGIAKEVDISVRITSLASKEEDNAKGDGIQIYFKHSIF